MRSTTVLIAFFNSLAILRDLLQSNRLFAAPFNRLYLSDKWLNPMAPLYSKIFLVNWLHKIFGLGIDENIVTCNRGLI